jgi:hypothetical protein
MNMYIYDTQVPCILGVNLTGKDLMEFIHQVTANAYQDLIFLDLHSNCSVGVGCRFFICMLSVMKEYVDFF